MDNQLIQKYFYTVPATTGTAAYSYNFKSDDLYNYLSGIACPLITSLPTADSIEIELRDDFKSILSFSPVQNWCKNTASVSWDMTNIFRPLAVPSQGKNFYLNVKVKNSTAAFTFVALFRQSLEVENVAIFNNVVQAYDMQSFTVANAALGVNYNFTLPSDYTNVAGVNFIGGDPANFYNIALDINDSMHKILDPVPVSILNVTENQSLEKTFFPLAFYSRNKEVNFRLTPLTSITYTPSDFTVTLLLTR